MRMVIPLRRMNSTLRIGLPYDYARQRGLQEGDQVVWLEDADGVRLKFVRIEEEPALPQPEEKVA